MPLAPVTYFAFNRPRHTAQTLAALAANPGAAETDLRVFVDGPRSESEQALVAEVRRVVDATHGFRSVRVEASATNQGLYCAITRGVSQVLDEAGRTIVLEDDILVSHCFLEYMNQALDRYEHDPRVGSIHAYAPSIENLPDYFFLRGADCWGWATWKDRWTLFNADALALLRMLVTHRLLTDFCANHGSDSLLYLVRRARGRNASWAILWHASLFLAGRLTLHPGASFVQNIGSDGSGTHSADSTLHHTRLRTTYANLPPLPIEENRAAAKALSDFLDAGTNHHFTATSRMMRRTYAKLAARFLNLLP